MIIVYYDGKCSLCRREINYYKKICKSNSFKWLDIANNPNSLKSLKITQTEALKYLHVQDKFFKIHKGVDAFIIIWKNLGYWKFLAFIISLPLIYNLAKFLYIKFANHRFSKLSHCQLSLK